MSELDDRRQRAFAEFERGVLDQRVADGAAKAIEVATRVTLTPEVIAAAFATGWNKSGEAKARARAVLEAAGFEVSE